MKKSVIYLLLTLVLSGILTSCKNDRHIVGINDTEIDNSQILNILTGKIDSINMYYIRAYGVSNNQSVLKKSPLDADSIQNQANGQNIFEADALGFFVGGALGIEAGFFVGTMLCPGVGTLAGAVVDGITSGIAQGILLSVLAARNSNCIALENADLYWNAEEWVNYNDNLLFDDELIGGNLGWYHNDIIQDLWNNSMFDISPESLLEYVVLYYNDNGVIEYENRETFISFLYEQLSFTWDDFQNYVNDEFYNILNGYMITITQIDEDVKYDYTRAVMEEIAQVGLVEEDIFMLNGTISTYYYSMQLWNVDAIFNVPREE